MNKEELGKKLVELGITSQNFYTKSTFIKYGDVCLGLYKREMNDDFYFFNTFDKKIYKFSKPSSIDGYQTDIFGGHTKYLIPLSECGVIWEEKEYVELPDAFYNSMTLRQYACIQLKVPESGLSWLDQLISKSLK